MERVEVNGLLPPFVSILRGRGVMVESFYDRAESMDDGDLKPS
jgi:hypothetical protein